MADVRLAFACELFAGGDSDALHGNMFGGVIDEYEMILHLILKEGSSQLRVGVFMCCAAAGAPLDFFGCLLLARRALGC